MLFVDESVFVVGSMNWDPRSAVLNTEMAVSIEQPDFVKLSLAAIEEKLANNAYLLELDNGGLVWRDISNNRILTTEPDASLWRRLGAWVSGLLPIESQL